MILSKSKSDKDISEDGLNTVQSPATNTGANFPHPIRNGKFQGTIWPTTPIGSLKIIDKYFPSNTVADPSSAKIQAAKYLKWLAP